MLVQLILISLTFFNALFSQSGGISISTPLSGAALQGTVSIEGSAAVENFASFDLAFQYQDSTPGTWFSISSSRSPVENDVLAIWDTSTITDGNYRLRLTVTRTDGSFEQVMVENVRVRNYTAIEIIPTARANQPTQILSTSAPPTSTPDLGPVLTPTPFKPNPAEITPTDLMQSVLQGILMMGSLFGLLVLFWLIRSWFKGH